MCFGKWIQWWKTKRKMSMKRIGKRKMKGWGQRIFAPDEIQSTVSIYRVLVHGIIISEADLRGLSTAFLHLQYNYSTYLYFTDNFFSIFMLCTVIIHRLAKWFLISKRRFLWQCFELISLVFIRHESSLCFVRFVCHLRPKFDSDKRIWFWRKYLIIIWKIVQVCSCVLLWENGKLFHELC